MKIYWASRLNSDKHRLENSRRCAALRASGYEVFLPQEVGILSNMIDEDNSERAVRHKLFEIDVRAINLCDIIVACFGFEKPSEGAVWEMGYAYGLGKPVLAYNPAGRAEYNLMTEGGSHVFIEWEDLLNQLIVLQRELKEVFK